jgi:hypothetical protein
LYRIIKTIKIPKETVFQHRSKRTQERIFSNEIHFQLTLMKQHEKNQMEQLVSMYELHDYGNISFDEIYQIKLSMDLN